MIVYEDERWTYREAYEFSSAFANSLINDFGVKKGDRIAIASRNYPEWIFSFIAITSIGAIAVPMNSWWTSKELEYGIEDSDSNIIIVDEERLNRVNSLSKNNNLKIIVIRPDNKNYKNNWTSFARKYLSQKMPILDINPVDDATILYTSGSTGHPKGVCSSHRSIISTLLQWMVVATARNIKDDILANEDIQPSCLLTVPGTVKRHEG